MNIEHIIDEAIARFTTAMKAGNFADARAVFRELLVSSAGAETHAQRLAAIGEDTSALAYYLGELGIDQDDVRAYLDRKLTGPELARYRAGRVARLLLVRAIQLECARSGVKYTGQTWLEQ